MHGAEVGARLRSPQRQHLARNGLEYCGVIRNRALPEELGRGRRSARCPQRLLRPLLPRWQQVAIGNRHLRQLGSDVPDRDRDLRSHHLAWSGGQRPTHFILETRDGIIYEYGNTADSRIESVGQTTARAWALNQIRDQSGNAIKFVYAEDTTNGAYRIDSIQYTSNVGQALTSAYEIDFVWQTKPSNEIDSGYIAGSKVKQITRLDYIDVKYNISTLVRRYELTNESALSSTSKSRLASIQECAGATPDCFAATTFNYQNGTSGLGTEVSMSMNMPTDPWPMDVNGDGRKDLVYSSHITSGSGTWMVMLANSSGGYNAPTNTGVTNTNYTGATPIDYNADGFEDMLVPYSSGTWWVMEGGASGLGSITNIGT